MLRSLAKCTLQDLSRKAVEAFGYELSDRSVSDLASRGHWLLRATKLSEIEAWNLTNLPVISRLGHQTQWDHQMAPFTNVVIRQSHWNQFSLFKSILDKCIVLLKTEYKFLSHVCKLRDNLLGRWVDIVLQFDVFLLWLGAKQVVDFITVDHVDTDFDEHPIGMGIEIFAHSITVDLNLWAIALQDGFRNPKSVLTSVIDREKWLSVRTIVFNHTTTI